MTKKDRQIVFEKYGGKCAYTGKNLPDDWQVDHMEHISSWKFRLYDNDGKLLYSATDFENLAPALKIVNHYKRALNLEGFRAYMLTFHKRLAKLPRNPQVGKSVKRKRYMLEVAEHFGITPEKPFCGKFYFETLTP